MSNNRSGSCENSAEPRSKVSRLPFLLWWPRWVSFWDRREEGTSLALFRMACGMCVLCSTAAVVVAGAVPLVWLSPEEGGYRIPNNPWLFQFLGGVSAVTVGWVITVTILAAACTVVGLGGRLPIFVALQGFLALFKLNYDSGGADDLVICNALWILVLSRGTATLSVDCRLRRGRWTSEELIPAWPRYVGIFQLVLIYWSTGVQKLGADWLPIGGYSALYYIMQQPTWQRFDMSWLAWLYPLTQVATAVTWLWEVTAPVLLLALWFRATRDRPGRLRAFFNWIDYRRWFVLLGLIMHISIIIFLEVGPFSWITMSFYLLLFTPREWSRWCLTGKLNNDSRDKGD